MLTVLFHTQWKCSSGSFLKEFSDEGKLRECTLKKWLKEILQTQETIKGAMEH